MATSNPRRAPARPARTRRTKPAPAPHVARPRVVHLAAYRRDELDELFATLDAPPPHAPSGRLRGRLFAVLPGGFWPRPLVRLQSWLLGVGGAAWAGKRFEGTTGANLLGSLHLGWEVGFFRLVRGVGGDGKRALLLDYDVPRNPAAIRSVLGELRVLGPDTYLARMRWRAGEHRVLTLLYFTLQAND